jgi:hypothetical protein
MLIRFFKRLRSLSTFVSALLLYTVFGALSSFQTCEAQQVVSGVQVFPSNNIWNKKINTLPVDANSATYVNSIGRTTKFHPDWGSPSAYGIPFNVTPSGTPFKKVTFEYFDESDAGPYPVNAKLLIEGGTWASSNDGDRHVLMIYPPTKTLYELFYTFKGGTGFTAGGGAIFRLDQNTLRPNGWTSADAAGLPVFPGLVNYDEAASGVIKHALRFTCSRTKGYIWPARHKAGSQITGWPPMGQRFRLKANYNISSFSTTNKAILTAMKEYGMFVADNGSNWYVSGTSDSRWNDNDLNKLKVLTGNDFEAVDERSLMVSPDSAQSK